MLKVARLQDRILAVAELHRFILCTRGSGDTAHEGGGCSSLRILQVWFVLFSEQALVKYLIDVSFHCFI